MGRTRSAKSSVYTLTESNLNLSHSDQPLGLK
jgi:hypothetical protein